MKQAIGNRRMPRANKPFFPNLDGLRCLAFFAVYLTHCFSANTFYVQQSKEYQWAVSFFSNGELGVSFFFVLSGFLITYLLLGEESIKHKINLFYFYVRRILRIWPLFFACVFFGFVVYPFLTKVYSHNLPTEQGSFFYYLTFTNNFYIIQNGWPVAPPLGVLWSISVEEQFYLFWPLILIAVRTHRIHLMGSVIILSLIFRCFYSSNELVLYLHTLSVISDMAVGGLLAVISFSTFSFREGIRNLTSPQIVLIYLIGILMIIFRDSWNSVFMLRPLERIFFAVFFAFIIAEQNYAEKSFLKMKSVKWLSKWGRYTYGLYCLHILAIIFVDNIFSFFNINDWGFSILLIKPLLSLWVAMLASRMSYQYYEKHFLRMKKMFRPI